MSVDKVTSQEIFIEQFLVVLSKTKGLIVKNIGLFVVTVNCGEVFIKIHIVYSHVEQFRINGWVQV